MILGYAVEHGLDNQGRILLPAPLQEFVGLGKNVILPGRLNKFKLWDADVWFEAKDQWIAEA